MTVALTDVLDRLGAIDDETAPGDEEFRRLSLPRVPVVEPWSGMSPPRSGWTPVGALAGADLDALATAGIAEVAADPTTRESVWRRMIPDTSVPAGAALALHRLGFTAPEIALHTNGRWARLSTPAGYVLTR